MHVHRKDVCDTKMKIMLFLSIIAYAKLYPQCVITDLSVPHPLWTETNTNNHLKTFDFLEKCFWYLICFYLFWSSNFSYFGIKH
jgi:hypothetical protein